jgi:REP element-mobilizing transposase RayT
MPFIRVWIHYVWATKNRQAILTEDIRAALFNHIKQNAITKKIYLDRINGYTEHVHCLVSLGSDQTIEKVAQLLKVESSF